MDEIAPFGTLAWFACLALLAFARGADLLSTRIATPNLVLEGNPIAKRLGWKWGAMVNVVLCASFAFWPLPAIVISTASILVAARNFQQAWLMRSFGEEPYRAWHVERMQEAPLGLYLFCLFGQTALPASVGVALICLGSISSNSSDALWVPIAIGWGIVSYATMVALFTLLSLWRIRRAMG